MADIGKGHIDLFKGKNDKKSVMTMSKLVRENSGEGKYINAIMTEDEIRKWKEIRSKGAFRYIIVSGILMGILMGIMMTIVPNLIVYRRLVNFEESFVWIRIGIHIILFTLFSLIDWIKHERDYKKLMDFLDNQ